ncbi:MAG: flavodoxin domain-containing protein [Candidatus Thermoplasmatota archaeon]|nr:flavodoxin domain-containing protein [Candidatus Thermoplasmatota archaeon]
MTIFSVYIDDGCIVCDACEEAAPDVFEVTDDTCFIKPTVRIDGGFDRNTDQSGLKPEIISAMSDDILDAAEACPVDVIMVAEGPPSEAAEAEEAPVPETPEAVPEEAAVEDVEVGEGIEQLLTVGDRSLDILFGSQSGNSEDLSAKLAKQAKGYGLEGTVHDMDGFDFNSLSGKKRVLIVCSTWGEGEMPDNAEELWQFASSDAAARLDGVHFSVCALGDTSYEFYCESGKDWDRRLEQLGATRLVDRVDCDVDYDSPAAAWAIEALPTLAAVDGMGKFREDMVDPIKDHVSGDGSGGAEGEDGFTLPTLLADSIQAEITIFRYDPVAACTGKDTWMCALPGHMSILDALRTLKDSQDGSLTFRDGACDDPNTAITVNGRLVMPGLARLDSVAPTRDGAVRIRIEPLPGFDVVRDLVIDPWSLERKRESSKPWMVAATREGASTPQGPMGTMDPAAASHLHSVTDYQSHTLLHASSDAVPHANGYLGPAVLASAWARRNDPRTSPHRRSEIDELVGSGNGIKAETDLAPIRRQASNARAISDTLLEAKTATLTRDAYNGRHGKHVWWYTWTVKSSGRVNDTVIYRQVLGPAGLLGNLFSGVTARMVFGFTRTGGNMFNGMLGMVAPPAGIGKMPQQFNSSIENHHEVVAIFNELDGRF